jgi:hypothetical protein
MEVLGVLLIFAGPLAENFPRFRWTKIGRALWSTTGVVAVYYAAKDLHHHNGGDRIALVTFICVAGLLSLILWVNWLKWRGWESWPSTTARIESSEVGRTSGRGSYFYVNLSYSYVILLRHTRLVFFGSISGEVRD